MSAFEDLKLKLREIFQLDRTDLDFGLYRIMNLKSDEVSKFIDNELLPQVQEGLKEYAKTHNDGSQEELDKLIETLKSAGMDPEASPKVKELRQKLADAFDVKKTENEIYSDLYNFFKRYYSEGDFLSLRRYKDGVYALPYEGQEVKLYWANADQYYIKSSEDLTNYTFKIADKKIRFEVVDAKLEQNNNKGDADRRFKLAEQDPVRTEDGAFIIPFSYLPDATKTKQEVLNKQTEEKLLKNSVLQPILSVLTANTNSGISALLHHINNFTAKHTFDYFIHKDLGGFLKRELDFYIKNEIMHLDDIESDTAQHVESYLCKVKVFKSVANKIIAFLTSVEEFQKKLWLKKKFVLETNYCITLDRVPESLYEEICANSDQIKEWIGLFSIDKLDNFSNPLKSEFLKTNKYLVLDTAFFSNDFKYKLLGSIDDLDQQCDGLLVHSENFQALNLLQEKYKGKVACIYIDPPFNTENDHDFPYKDNYRTSSWLSFMNDRLNLSKLFLEPNLGSFYLHLDENADYFGRMLLENSFHKITNEIIWDKGFRGTESNNIYQHSHDIVFYVKLTSSGIWNTPVQPYKDLKLGRYNKTDENGKKYALVKRQRTNGEVYYGKVYPKEEGKSANDVISHIPTMASTNTERIAEFKTQKPEELMKFFLSASSNEGDIILDFFAGSATTFSTAYKLCRKAITMEMGTYFDAVILPRTKRILYGDTAGLTDYTPGGTFKYIRLESYEDTLDNLQFYKTQEQTDLLNSTVNKSIKEQYMLNYMMDLETKDSLLNVTDFNRPYDYEMKITRDGETKTVKVDLVETFNYLIGLNVTHMQMVKNVLAIEGTTRDAQRTLVLWRNTDEVSNKNLDAWFEKQKYSTQDMEFDVIYVNGNNNLENLRKSDETWKVRLTEEEFLKRMFDVKDI